MVRSILAVICGIVAGSLCNMAIIMLSWVIYPLPEGANTSDPETMKTYVASLPAPAFLLILAAHAGGALVGGFVAALIARRSPMVFGAIIGGIFLLGGIYAVATIPSPLWFAVVDLLFYAPCGILGAWLAPRPAPAAAPGDAPP